MPESVFALHAQVTGHLCGMFARLQTLQTGGGGPVEFNEEGVGAVSFARLLRDADGVVESLGAIAGHPDHSRGGQLVAWLVLIFARLDYALDQPGVFQAFQELLDDRVGIVQAQLFAKSGSAPEILAEAPARREVDIAAIVVAAAPPGKEDGG